MKVLITGGAGFIGSNLAKHLLAQSNAPELTVIDDLSTGIVENIANLDLDFVQGSILDSNLMKTVTRDMSAIIHLAAIPSVPRSIANPEATHEANTTGTLTVLQAARTAGVPHVVVASSSSVYGRNPKMPKNELDWTSPMSPYAVSKLATEHYALAYQSSYGLDTLAFRFFNVYGPGQAADHAYAAVIPKFLSAAFADEPLAIHGDGMQARDFTYVGTVCEVLTQAVNQHISSPTPINLAYGTHTSLIELVSLLEEELGKPLQRQHGAPRIGDVRASQADGVRIREVFDSIEPISLQSGLRDTISWFRSRHTQDS